MPASAYNFTADDHEWMQHALSLAERAEAQGEVPVGALIVLDDEIIGEGWNRPIGAHDPTAHAEIVALRDAGRGQQNYRFPGSTLYVTLEPCVMCVGAIIHARVARLIYGANDPKGGGVISVYNILEDNRLNHRVEFAGGLMAEQCAAQLKAFFQRRR